MTNKKTTKRALFMSLMAMLLCFTMLLGTTYAWFTDSAASANNIITSGNLDVVLEYKTSVDGVWTPVTESTKIFKDGALYEPGYTEIVFLRVSNAGSLALKYNLNINIFGEKTSTNVYGETFSLKDHLEIGYYTMDESLGQYLLGTMFGTREAAMSHVTTTKLSADTGIVRENSPVLPGNDTAQLITLVLTMPETVGNEANHRADVAAPEIELGISLLATQYIHEKDSFGNQYDADAEYPVVVSNSAELVEAFKDGGSIQLTANIDVPATLRVEPGVAVNLDLNGKTITVPDGSTSSAFNSLFYAENGSDITISGNGTVNLGENGMSLVVTRGNVTIENGTFIRKVTDPSNAYPLISDSKYADGNGTTVINGGYFDGGYYDENAADIEELLAGTKTLKETADDIAKRGNSGDKNLVRVAIKDNITGTLNLSKSTFKVYGGTFVGANPAWGDEGAMLPTTPNYLRPWSYYQGALLDGQTFNANGIVLPEGYTITKGTTADGIPTYTVEYSK